MKIRTFLLNSKLRKLMKLIEVDIESAAEGKLPDFEEELPDFITKELIISIVEEIAIFTMVSVTKICGEFFIAQKPVSSKNHELFKKIDEIPMNNFKLNLLKQRGFDKFEVHPFMVYQQALKLFLLDKDFAKKVDLLEKNNRALLDRVFGGEMNVQL